MKHFLSHLMVGLVPMMGMTQAQWPAERHPLYDAMAPTEASKEAAATQLALFNCEHLRLTSDTKPDALPALTYDAALRLQGWRGERCSTQLAVVPNGPVTQLQVSCGGLSMGADTLPVRVSFIRYTKAHGTPTADIIDREACCDSPGNLARGIWLQVDIPQGAKAGLYSGELIVSAPGCQPVKQALQLDVATAVLPEPAEWKMHLDLWQYPYSVARWHDVEPWSPEHFALLKPQMKRLAEAGQKCITCTLLDEAWNAQTYDWYPGMVRWIRDKNGHMRYDYSALDAWLRFMHDEIGIREQISCYTMIPWHLSVRFFDEASGCYNQVTAKPGTPEYDALWAPFLRDFHRHMQEMGWSEKTCIAIDERPDAYVRAAMKLVSDNAPDFRIASAVDRPSALTRDVYNISPVLTHAGSALGELLKERQAAGKITTFYVCLHPRKPNTFTHSEPAQAEWLGFFAAANRLDGFLRWAYDAWNRNPFETTDFIHWPSGDCFLIYPGNRSSVRFERLREGIEQYEKINQLRARASESPRAAEIIRQLDEQLATLFTVERSQGDAHTADVLQARALVEHTLRQLESL